MNMTSYVRGQTIHFTATFTDVNGDPFAPVAPTITIDYPRGRNRRAQTSIDLELGSEGWGADWDSGTAGGSGQVYWTVYSGAPEPKIADDGEFTLTANASNLEAV